MTQMWQMTKEMLAWLMGAESDEMMKCNCECLEDEFDDNEMVESSGLGRSLVVHMVLVGLFIGGYLIQNHLDQQCRSRRQREQEQQDRLIELTTTTTTMSTMTTSSNRNLSIRIPTDNLQDVLLLPHGEEISWLIHAQQHNLLLLNNDHKQLRQLQQQLMLTLSQQDVFYDLPPTEDDDSDEDHFKDIPDSSRIELIPRPASTPQLQLQLQLGQ